MTKIQKIWFYVGLALFLVPEILWSPVGNFVYELFHSGDRGGTNPFRSNWLVDSSNINWYSAVLLVQFFGLLICAVYCLLHVRKSSLFTALSALFLFLSIATLLLFGMSISLRSIGF